MFVHVLEGDSPLVITVPHDGWLHFIDLHERAQVRCWRSLGWSDPRDERTLQIAREIRRQLAPRGLCPTLICITVHRAHCDVNRAPGREPFVPGFRDTYEVFHTELDNAIHRARNRHGRALVIDLHGFLHPPGRTADIVLGTRGGSTSLNNSDQRIATALVARGCDAVFSPDPTLGVGARHRGGFTVARVGDAWHNEPVDAVQLELSANTRAPHILARTTCNLADAIFNALAA